MNPIISIIIPCYNSEFTLQTTLESVISQDFQDWEAIIINDGSIDKTEEIALNWTKKDERFKYFSKHNKGLAKTRNYGIARSSGVYILPLDSDNQLEKDFAISAITIFEKDSSIGVIHGDAEYFGERNGLWEVEEYNLKKILAGNYIDACAIYRKKIWEQVGGYDEKMPFQGHEDWELWLAFGIINVRFHHLKKITFRYFVSSNSMIRSFTYEMLESNQDYITKKYSKQYYEQYSKVFLIALDIDKLKNESVFAKTSKDLFCIILSRIKKRLWKK
ncbi:glycosyltransferase family 2 protein [Flavobacterium sp. LS2R12]|uniref:glycosyltransferase family 2 protein n=1 Tax=unclassified Flavobacterium TaxID=196869 RepID=UPI003AB0A0A5